MLVLMAADWGAAAAGARLGRGESARTYANLLFFRLANALFLSIPYLYPAASSGAVGPAAEVALLALRTPFAVAFALSAFYAAWAWFAAPTGPWMRRLFRVYAAAYAVASVPAIAAAAGGDAGPWIDRAYRSHEALTLGLLAILFIPWATAARAAPVRARKAARAYLALLVPFLLAYAADHAFGLLDGFRAFSSAELAVSALWAGASLFLQLTSNPALPTVSDSEPTAALDGMALRFAWTERESKVARLLLRGLPNKLIAADLGIQESTVKAHLTSLYRKTGTASRFEWMNKVFSSSV